LYAELFARRSFGINASREGFIDAALNNDRHSSLENILEVVLMLPSRLGENQVGG
jgi:hypothetical protein